MKGAIVINSERCKGCNLCAGACPLHLIGLTQRTVNTKGYPYATVTEPDKCTGCTSCAIVCPDGCISVYRQK